MRAGKRESKNNWGKRISQTKLMENTEGKRKKATTTYERKRKRLVTRKKQKKTWKSHANGEKGRKGWGAVCLCTLTGSKRQPHKNEKISADEKEKKEKWGGRPAICEEGDRGEQGREQGEI